MEQSPEPSDIVASLFTDTDLDEIQEAVSQPPPTEHKQLIVESAQPKAIEPILKVSENIINGIIPIKIENLHDLFQDIDESVTFFCSITFRYNFSSPMKGYKNGLLLSRKFDTLSQDGSFFIRVPLFLLPYSMDFVISINFPEINLETVSEAYINIQLNTTPDR